MDEDRHADERDRKREKARKGMRVTNNSIKLIESMIGRRASGDAPPTSGKRKRKRKRSA